MAIWVVVLRGRFKGRVGLVRECYGTKFGEGRGLFSDCRVQLGTDGPFRSYKWGSLREAEPWSIPEGVS